MEVTVWPRMGLGKQGRLRPQPIHLGKTQWSPANVGRTTEEGPSPLPAQPLQERVEALSILSALYA